MSVTRSTSDIVASVISEMFNSKEFQLLIQNCVEKALDTKLESFLLKIEENTGRIHDLEVGQDKIKSTISKIDEHVISLQESCKRSLREVNELEQYSRRNCLRVFGIPEKRGENTGSLIIDLAKDKLDIELATQDIDRSHRVGPLNSKSRAIIIKFSNYEARTRLIRNRRKLKGTAITIREDLTKANQELLQAAKNNPKVKTAWTHDGKVIVLLSRNGKEETKRIFGKTDLSLI